MTRTKRMLLTGLSVVAVAGALMTSTSSVQASNAGTINLARPMPPSGTTEPDTVYWWVEAGAALAGGAAGGAAAGALGGPGGAAAGAAAGGVGGLVGYVVSSLFGVAQESGPIPAMVHALD